MADLKVEDGIVLDGMPGFRTEYRWEVVDDRLIVDGEGWNIRFRGGSFTAYRFGDIYRYICYNDSMKEE